jgi:hypothetical protein
MQAIKNLKKAPENLSELVSIFILKFLDQKLLGWKQRKAYLIELLDSFSTHNYRITNPSWNDLVETRLQENFMTMEEAMNIKPEVALMLEYLYETRDMHRISSEYFDQIMELKEQAKKTSSPKKKK